MDQTHFLFTNSLYLGLIYHFKVSDFFVESLAELAIVGYDSEYNNEYLMLLSNL